MSEVLNSTLPQEHLDQINHWIPLLVSLMSNGTPKEIAKGLESQFVDRSTEHLYRKVTPTDQSGSTEVYKYVKGEIESAFIPTRRDMKLSFPPTCYSSNDPITLLYESNYKLIQFWPLAILENDDVMGALLDGMLQAGVGGSNVDEFLNTECAVLAHLQQMPMIASIQRKMPDYYDFNRFKPNNFRYLDAQKRIEHTRFSSCRPTGRARDSAGAARRRSRTRTAGARRP